MDNPCCCFLSGESTSERKSLLKIALYTLPLVLLVVISSLVRAQTHSAPQHHRTVNLPPAFPADAYTPHGYIDNPYHSMVFNRSGVIRSFPPLGFGWWRAEFTGGYGGGARDHVNYVSILQMSVRIGAQSFVRSDDFRRSGVNLYSAYHTKHMVSYDWQWDSVAVSLKYFLPREHTIACLAEFENAGGGSREVILNATNMTSIGDVKWWGSDGLTARYSTELDACVGKIWAYGDVFIIGSEAQSFGHAVNDREVDWENWIRGTGSAGSASTSTRGRGPLWAAQRYGVTLQGHSHASILICLSRGKNEEWAAKELKVGRRTAVDSLQYQLARDQEFWSRCPVPAGDWPETWKRGWVYDFETLRMNVRPPVGIFNHPWDAMQIHSPRVVLGETSLDMLTFSYADPELAKEVIYGTFADALSPNVPCAREDGSVNMISSDGSECGTAPMWGYPFHVIKSIYSATLDTAWIRNLYPHLKAYIQWWLEHRTDAEGWLHCNNSWESGQDGSRRFLVAERNEGAVADFVRTVDVEASMAEAMKTMQAFADITGMRTDVEYWRALAERRIKNTREMFFSGWFRDVDARSKNPIILPDYFDVMMLAPLTCGIATPDQIKAVRPMFRYFQTNPGHWLEWPPHLITFTEAAWNARMMLVASEVVAETADRVYGRLDLRDVRFAKERDQFSYRIPGVANEFWPVADRLPGGENYGWGATLPMHIVRCIVGFRETDDVREKGFTLAPSLPRNLMQEGKKYELKNLEFRRIRTDVAYEVKDANRIRLTVRYHSPNPVSVLVLDDTGKEMARRKELDREGVCSFTGSNGVAYSVKFVEVQN